LRKLRRGLRCLPREAESLLRVRSNLHGYGNLRFIARELLKTIRENVTIDWTAKESVRAKLRVMVKRVLRKHGYPPDKQEKATQTVLQQAELLCAEWNGQSN